MGKVVQEGEAMHHTNPLRKQVCNVGKMDSVLPLF